jgi:Na+/H+-dicarboxylate symporter
LQPSSSLPILFDVALHCVILQAKGKETQLLGVLSEADRVFTLIIHWIMVLTPIAVFFLIASAIREQSELAQTFKYIGFLFCFHLFLAIGLQVWLHDPWQSLLVRIQNDSCPDHDLC